MDINYMQSLFHRTHYEFFYRALPVFLRSEIIDQIVDGARQGIGNQYLVGFWRGTAKNVAGLALTDPVPREVDLTRDDFTCTVMDPAPGTTLLLMTGPAPRGPVEAGCAVAVFDNSDPVATLRYFTSESPVEPSFPWMVGEWYEGGSRVNLGGLLDVSAQGMCNFVLERMGISTHIEISPPKPSRPPVKLDLSFSAKWTSSTAQVANETLEMLHRLRLGGGTALVMNAKKTRGLGKKLTSYVQFMWNDDGSLVAEVQGDYSYWGLEVPTDKARMLQDCGLAAPSTDSPNFSMLVPAGADLQEQQSILISVFEAFQEVLQPDGKIHSTHF